MVVSYHLHFWGANALWLGWRKMPDLTYGLSEIMIAGAIHG